MPLAETWPPRPQRARETDVPEASAPRTCCANITAGHGAPTCQRRARSALAASAARTDGLLRAAAAQRWEAQRWEPTFQLPPACIRPRCDAVAALSAARGVRPRAPGVEYRHGPVITIIVTRMTMARPAARPSIHPSIHPRVPLRGPRPPAAARARRLIPSPASSGASRIDAGPAHRSGAAGPSPSLSAPAYLRTSRDDRVRRLCPASLSC
eukprot:scaffold1659_cov371-Prasinococcus_capsulatus_cf.AAC.8